MRMHSQFPINDCADVVTKSRCVCETEMLDIYALQGGKKSTNNGLTITHTNVSERKEENRNTCDVLLSFFFTDSLSVKILLLLRCRLHSSSPLQSLQNFSECRHFLRQLLQFFLSFSFFALLTFFLLFPSGSSLSKLHFFFFFKNVK